MTHNILTPCLETEPVHLDMLSIRGNKAGAMLLASMCLFDFFNGMSESNLITGEQVNMGYLMHIM